MSISDIEDKVAANEMTASQVFTKMRTENECLRALLREAQGRVRMLSGLQGHCGDELEQRIDAALNGDANG